MAKLSSKVRNKLPMADFGLPGEKKYPMPDKNHARVAKSYASKEYNAGKLSAASKSKIDKKANAKLTKKGK